MTRFSALNRQVKRGIVVAALGAAAVLVAAPANASSSDCPLGYSCVWKDAGYVTSGVGANYWGFKLYYTDFSGTAAKYKNTSTQANDNASSVYNNGNQSSVTYYRDANKGGWSIFRAKQTGYENLNTVSANDALSSGYFAGY